MAAVTDATASRANLHYQAPTPHRQALPSATRAVGPVVAGDSVCLCHPVSVSRSVTLCLCLCLCLVFPPSPREARARHLHGVHLERHVLHARPAQAGHAGGARQAAALAGEGGGLGRVAEEAAGADHGGPVGLGVPGAVAAEAGVAEGVDVGAEVHDADLLCAHGGAAGLSRAGRF